MFLIERLFGVCVYTYALVMACVLIGFTNIRTRSVLRLYTVGLCVMAFFYTPYVTGDLYRIYETMEWYQTMELEHFVENYVVTASAPASRMLYWLVSQTGIYNLVPVISCLLSYGVMFNIIGKVEKRFSISRVNVALTLFFVMSLSIYISVVGGIRMMTAISLIIYCFFNESVEGKFKWYHILIYITAILTHNMALIIVCIRVLVLILDTRKKPASRILMGGLILGLAIVLIFRFEYVVVDILTNAGGYLSGESYSDTWEYIMGAMLMVFYAVLGFRFRSHGGSVRYPALKEYNMAMFLFMGIALAFCFVFSIFYRFIGHVVPIMGLPMLMITLQESSKNSPVRLNWMSTQGFVLIWGAVLLLLSCSRGSLSSLKFFVLG